MALSLEVIIDREPGHVYSYGDPVTGRVVLKTDKQEKIKYLKVRFYGVCRTFIIRSYYSGNDKEANVFSSSRRVYEDFTTLFSYDNPLVAKSFALAPNTHIWNFEFNFPFHTERRYRSSNSKHFSRDPHLLPPTFQISTDCQGRGSVAYYVEARLGRSGFRNPTVKSSRPLLFQRRGRPQATPRIISHYMDVQCWKYRQHQDSPQKTPEKLTKLFRGIPTLRSPRARFIPILNLPKAVAPRQPIPISLSIRALQKKGEDAELTGFVMTSLQVDITTHSRIACGGLFSRPKESVSRTVRCIDRQNCHVFVPADEVPVPLVRDFRLIDNAEAVPSFKSYTISRYYVLTITISLFWNDRTWTIVSNRELGILPRHQPTVRRTISTEFGEVDPLPTYTPHGECAPEYNERNLRDSSYFLLDPPNVVEDHAVAEEDDPSADPTTPTLGSGCSDMSPAMSTFRFQQLVLSMEDDLASSVTGTATNSRVTSFASSVGNYRGSNVSETPGSSRVTSFASSMDYRMSIGTEVTALSTIPPTPQPEGTISDSRPCSPSLPLSRLEI